MFAQLSGDYAQRSMSTGEKQIGAMSAPFKTNEYSSNGSSASITANDFLTLLVTEMKNQDPTANSDPNEYINQLVQVNSLQQLISINETLTSGMSGDSSQNAAPKK
jgi:flagellar basal-body rod modification protein FlgD